MRVHAVLTVLGIASLYGPAPSRAEGGCQPCLSESSPAQVLDAGAVQYFPSGLSRWDYCGRGYGDLIFSKRSPSARCRRPLQMPETQREPPLPSSAQSGPWSHSLFARISSFTDKVLYRGRRESLPRHKNIRSLTKAYSFGLTFHKCAQVVSSKEFPTVTFMLIINNTRVPSAADLSQLSIRDAVTGLTLLSNGGNLLESGFQTFTTDSLMAGSHYTIKYTALIKGVRNEMLALPAYLTFSNASQNDINLFGPLVANFTLRLNSTEKISSNHGIHFVGFLVGFIVSFMLACFGVLSINWISTTVRKIPRQQRRNRSEVNGETNHELAICNINETSKEEAAFEDKIVDIMVLEDPQNMYQALENLDMSNLLRAAASLESYRVQVYKDVIAKLLRNLKINGDVSALAEKRLTSVLNGQLMGMEGKLKEEHVARMAALAAQCNLETQEEMEAEHRRVTAEKAQAEHLFQHMDQQAVLECSVLLDKLHKLDHSHLQRCLLVRHEEASAKVQRQIVVCRRVELHKIFFEELEEATRMGELEKNVANGLLHAYFVSQDQLEEVLDVFLANQRNVLGERHAQRQFLVHSLQSLKSLICDVFTKTSGQMEGWFQELKNEGYVTEEQVDLLLEKAKKELLHVKQNLDEILNREKNALHCSLIKKRRTLISDKLKEHKQKQKDLSATSKTSDANLDLTHYLNCWQNLLTSQCLELGELINNLDEEGAADIRKVTMRLIQSAMSDIKAIQSNMAQTLTGLGAPRYALQHAGLTHELVSSALTEVQERLHIEGKMAVKTLQRTRDSLQEQLGLEVQEQQVLRHRGRTVFQNLCAAQLALSDDELLKMKLEFQNCLSRMDNCLVLPRALARSRLQAYLSEWRKAMLMKMEHSYITQQDKQKKSKVKKHSFEVRQIQDLSEFLVLRKRTEEKIQLYEQEKEMEDTAMKKVLVEMRYEREDLLKAQEDRLAVHIASLQFQKAERRAKTLEAYSAILNLQTVLVEELRISGAMASPEIAQAIQNHSHGLEDAESVLHKELAEWDALIMEHSLTSETVAPSAEIYKIEEDCRIAVSLQQSLNKCQQVIGAQRKRLSDNDTRCQIMEDLKEKLEFKRIHIHFDQDLEFAANLIKQCQISANILLEVLHLLLPTSSESDLISLVDALCPKTSLPLTGNEKVNGWAEGSRKSLLSKLREDIIYRHLAPAPLVTGEERNLVKKHAVAVDKLFSFPHLETSEIVSRSLVQENAENQCPSPAAEILDLPDTGEKVFVFRSETEQKDSSDTVCKMKKKKRNFLNFKKAAVANLE
ncbi:limbin isoform X2 [Amia ocellicauda]|uniref:limbin isoform X2 n=1 Tax=Amia ocellicauda TaxID=2972642 RepID=UPI0034648D69